MNDIPKVAVVGARRDRQGIGEFITRYLSVAGAEICAVVGTSTQTANQTCETLKQHIGTAPKAYTCLKNALRKESIDIVVICCPYQFHREYLEITADFGLHCLCEKPLWWEDSQINRVVIAQSLVNKFIKQKKLLSLVTQWPYTLSGFYKLHPQLKNAPIKKFDMLLGPIHKGPGVVLDAIPHVLSMLQKLAGNGQINNPQAIFKKKQNELQINFTFVSGSGNIKTSCRFITTKNIPRPAGYAINDCWVNRTIELPEYKIAFTADTGKIYIEDPLLLLVTDFIGQVNKRIITDEKLLISSIKELEHLYTITVEEVNRTTNN